MNHTDIVEWQLVDESIDAVYPWLTHPFLEILNTWDLTEKRILEFGGGLSSRWWRKKAKWVTTIDTNHDWMIKIVDNCTGLDNGKFIYHPIKDGDEEKQETYLNSGDEFGPYDIVVVDGIFRNECLKKGIELLSVRGGIIIADNWDQDFVWISQEAIDIMAPYDQYIFPQPDHTNHEGNCWKTAYFIIPPKDNGTIPEDFQVTNAWDSHRPMLWVALKNTIGMVVEFGCGDGSTQLLHKLCWFHGRFFFSFETNKEWANKFNEHTSHVQSYDLTNANNIDGFLFIDCAPAEERGRLIDEYRSKAKLLIIHDTEPGSEYVYHLESILNSFKYRCDLLVAGQPQTTAVSDTYDFSDWKGLYDGKYHFV